MRIGTAGWAVSREVAAQFAGDGRHLQRYARVLGCAEINSSFHRSHRVAVYERWAASTPPAFRFAAKLPRALWPADADCWCVFDNTASGAAIANALEMQALIDAPNGVG